MSLLSPISSAASWLAADNKDPLSTKHHGWAHPITVMIVHYGVLIAIAFLVHDWLIPIQQQLDLDDNTPHKSVLQITDACTSFRQSTATFLACYSAWFLPWRLRYCHPAIPRNSVLYEFTWLCNVTMVLGALALVTDRPMIATACCASVGIDQLLWYVDLLGFLLCGVFPVGVAKYLTWPETSWKTRITATHHLWTIPLILVACGGVVPASSLVLSFILNVTSLALSRLMIPAELKVGKQYKYLNVNCAHELWKDIKIQFLQINHDDPSCLLYFFRLLWRWQAFDTLVCGILVGLCKLCFAGDHHVCKPPPQAY